MDNQNTERYELHFDIDGIRQLKSMVDYMIETWPGAPKRPAQEQEYMWHIRDLLNMCMMEHNFRHLEVEDK